jgi:hypothetical protein
MSKEENLENFDSYCEEIAEFANLVKDGIYKGWEFKGSGEFDIEQIEKILQNAKEDKALLESDLTIIREFGEHVIEKINNQQN